MRGYVKWFNDKLGYGFIKSEEVDKDIFVHFSEINKKGYKKLYENDIVTFKYDKEKNRAYDLKIIKTKEKKNYENKSHWNKF
jgi:CspA family cold shock protein